jgi:HSP20 family molecular chaperone IbpA
MCYFDLTDPFRRATTTPGPLWDPPIIEPKDDTTITYTSNTTMPILTSDDIKTEESDTCYYVWIIVPGCTKEDISISLDKDLLLTIKTKAELPWFETLEPEERTYYSHLSSPVEVEKIKAFVELGILHVSLPKTEDTKTLTIPVG